MNFHHASLPSKLHTPTLHNREQSQLFVTLVTSESLQSSESSWLLRSAEKCTDQDIWALRDKDAEGD